MTVALSALEPFDPPVGRAVASFSATGCLDVFGEAIHGAGPPTRPLAGMVRGDLVRRPTIGATVRESPLSRVPVEAAR